MSYYHAEVINLSVNDRKMIYNFSVLNLKKRFMGLVKIYTIEIPEDDVEKTILMFQKNISTKLHKDWYITFHNAEKVIIVFRNKIFNLSGKGVKPVYRQCLNTENTLDKESWDDVIKYAKSLGIPDSQCDFLPEDFWKKVY